MLQGGVYGMLSLSAITSDGYIFYDPNGSGFPNIAGNDTSPPGGGGGVAGGGSIWSSCDQIIWVSCGGLRYPIWVKAGWNDIWFWIPSIFPNDTWIDATLIIEADGYILIPAGFEWNVVTGIGAPPEPLVIRFIDKIAVKDSVYIDFRYPDIPHDPVIIDTVDIRDEVYIASRKGGYIDLAFGDTVDIGECVGSAEDSKPDLNIDLVDTVNIQDSYSITMRVPPTPPMSGDPKIDDIINIMDSLYISSKTGYRTNSTIKDTISIREELRVDFKYTNDTN